MTLTLNLPPELAGRLADEARRQGLSVDAYALRLLCHQLSPADLRSELVALVQSWIDDDDINEQRETGAHLIRSLDEDRLSDRKLFPPEMQGVTW